MPKKKKRNSFLFKTCVFMLLIFHLSIARYIWTADTTRILFKFLSHTHIEENGAFNSTEDVKNVIRKKKWNFSEALEAIWYHYLLESVSCWLRTKQQTRIIVIKMLTDTKNVKRHFVFSRKKAVERNNKCNFEIRYRVLHLPSPGNFIRGEGGNDE